MDFKQSGCLIVGAGFFGAVIAERIANDLGKSVCVIDKRDHIGGNCYSSVDAATGIEYHQYGTHIFHTAHPEVWEYLNQFTGFNGYRHQVLTTYQNKVYQMPVNLETINSFYTINLKPYEVEAFIQDEINKSSIREPRNLEEKAISLVGRPLYEALIKGYTLKQWQRDPKELPAFIIERLPVRMNYDESYYYDRWQGMPINGYTKIFERMLDHPKIEVKLKTDFFAIREDLPEDCLIVYSGPLDRFFDYKFGKLEWRALDFHKEVVTVEDFQGTSVMNYAEAQIPYTRIHEPRHLHPERLYTKEKTLIFREFPQAATSDDEPFYPVNVDVNRKVQEQYVQEGEKLKNVIFGGRLADYKYYDMDKTIKSALDVYATKIKRRGMKG